MVKTRNLQAALSKLDDKDVDSESDDDWLVIAKKKEEEAAKMAKNKEMEAIKSKDAEEKKKLMAKQLREIYARKKMEAEKLKEIDPKKKLEAEKSKETDATKKLEAENDAKKKLEAEKDAQKKLLAERLKIMNGRKKLEVVRKVKKEPGVEKKAEEEAEAEIQAEKEAEAEEKLKEKEAKKKAQAEKKLKEKAVKEKEAIKKAEELKKKKEIVAKEKEAKEKQASKKAEELKKLKEIVAKEKEAKKKLEEDKKLKENVATEIAEEQRRLNAKRDTEKKAKERKSNEVKNAITPDSMALVIVPQPIEDDKFDEEADGRDDFFTAKMAEEFAKEEVHIRHDQYPDSDEEREHRKEPNKDNPHFHRGDGSIYLGQTFYNRVAVKECVTDYCLRTGYNIKQYRHDKDKMGFKCVGSETCKFQVYASTLPRDKVWRVRIFKHIHSCIPNGRCHMMKIPVIARLFVDKIRDEPDYYVPNRIEKIILEKWKISVTRGQCQVARNNALRWLDYEADQQFARLRDYGEEILASNVGSTVVIDTTKNEANLDLFNRFYVCFDALRKTWKQTCRPLIGVDGCFLKNKIKGQLLVAIGRDADNAIYPIAWSVVQVENKDNWLWFIQLLKQDLDLNDGDGFIMVSDRQKGLRLAVEAELPKIEHRMCVRHIYGNLKKDHPSKIQLKPLLWNLAWSYNETEYQQRLERIRCYDTGVYESVIKAKPRTWCRAFYKIGSYCEDIENNSTESFNRTLTKAREKPFVAMLEAVRRLAMVRIAKRSALSHDHQGICTPYATNFLAREHEVAATCLVSPSTNGQYEVQLSGNYYRVCLGRMSCTCCKFQICGIPCEHAYAVILNKKLNPEDYVCHWFRTSMWRMNYTEGLVPQRGPSFWPCSGGDDIHIPPEPAQPGRKKVTKAEKKRKRGECESPTKKQPKQKKRSMHCSICGSDTHNCRTHARHVNGNQTQENVSQTQENASQISASIADETLQVLGN